MNTEINDLERGFHNRDGWMFRRDSDEGHVRIWKIRWEIAQLPCTCGHFRHQTQERDGFQCASVDANGKVLVNKPVPVLEAGPLVIPENEWASIVASVSKGGETATSWQFVRDFHNSACKRD